MAHKYLVFSTFGESLTGERLKKSVGRLLVRRLLADFVRDQAGRIRGIRRRAIGATRDSDLFAKVEMPEIIRFVPVFLPPAEVSGCKYIPPKNDARPNIAIVRAGWDWTREPDYLSEQISA